MVYRVKLDVFEGPFDLLLHLISRQKLDIRDVPLATITDEYLAYIDKMRDLDLDVASDFLLVAATLLELKASSLLPAGPLDTDDLDELSSAESSEVLIARLVEYRSFKGAAAELEARADAISKLHPREAGLEDRFAGLLPDFLASVTMDELAFRCARLLARREVTIIESSHIGAVPLSVERHIEEVMDRVRRDGRVSFVDLVDDADDRAKLIVTFLAVLELYKRGLVGIAQAARFGTIELAYTGEAA